MVTAGEAEALCRTFYHLNSNNSILLDWKKITNMLDSITSIKIYNYGYGRGFSKALLKTPFEGLPLGKRLDVRGSLLSFLGEIPLARDQDKYSDLLWTHIYCMYS